MQREILLMLIALLSCKHGIELLKVEQWDFVIWLRE